MNLAEVRARYADEIAARAGVKASRVRDAFASVPRERFVGPPPWTTLDPWAGLETRTAHEPADLYRDVLVSIDRARNLNNGQPSLHALLIEALAPGPGETVVHVGAGTGYYTAILANCVGASGTVIGVEIDAELAVRAQENLRAWRWVRIHLGDGATFDPGAVDAIYVSAGATHVPDLWLERLEPSGRIVVPLTCSGAVHTGGQVLVVRREPAGFGARFLGPVGIYPCIQSRDPEIEKLLLAAFLRGAVESVRSLRRDAHLQEPACWLHTEGFCLSTTAPGISAS